MTNAELHNDLVQILAENRRTTFTVENGRGETYSNNRPTMYAHSVYPRSSVLAGRERRVYIHQWNTWQEAHEAIAFLRKQVSKPKIKIDVWDGGGSSHIPIANIVAHLPDDTDY